jgi:hypothetical protein
MPVTTPKDGLFRASLVLEYDDGTVHTLRVEHPFDARAQVNYPDVHPVDIYLGEPTYLPLLAGQLEVVVRMKAGESPVIYRHDD